MTKTTKSPRARISIPIGDWRLEGYAHGFKFGRMRPVEIEGRRTFVLAEPVRYYPSLVGALRALVRLALQGEIEGVGPDDVSTLQELVVLVGEATAFAQAQGDRLDAKLEALAS
jgi:hypothetical protein